MSNLDPTAPSSGHLKPVRGRPKKKPLPQEVAEGKQRKGRGRGEEPEVAGDLQHAVVYVHAEDLSAPDSAPLLLASQSPLPAGGAAAQELVEVMISEGTEQCIVVQGQQAVGELLILQEEDGGLCSVAQTVEIDTV